MPIEHPHRVQPTRRLQPLLEISREVGLLQRAPPRSIPRRIVHVEQKATRRILQLRHLVQRSQPMPVRRRICAVHRVRVVETRIALRNKVAMPVRNRAVGIGVDRVIGRVRHQLHGLAILRVIARLCAQITLLQCLHRCIHQLEGDQVFAVLTDHRTMRGI